MRMEACREELNILLLEERLAGATLLVLANKQDLPGALSAQEIKDVSFVICLNNLCNFIDFFSYIRFSNWTTSQHIIGRLLASVLSRVISC